MIRYDSNADARSLREHGYRPLSEILSKDCGVSANWLIGHKVPHASFCEERGLEGTATPYGRGRRVWIAKKSQPDVRRLVGEAIHAERNKHHSGGIQHGAQMSIGALTDTVSEQPALAPAAEESKHPVGRMILERIDGIEARITSVEKLLIALAREWNPSLLESQ